MRTVASAVAGMFLLGLTALMPFDVWGQAQLAQPSQPPQQNQSTQQNQPAQPSQPAQQNQPAQQPQPAPPAEQTQTNQKGPQLVRLAYSSGWDGLPAVVGIERGFFHQENLVVSGLPIGNAEAIVNSIAAGSTDFAAVPQRMFIALAVANLPIKAIVIGVSGTQMELVVKAGSGIKSVTDLKGKTIAVARATESLAVLYRVLNAEKMHAADVKITMLDAAALESAFDKGTTDAIFESRHYTAPMVQAGKAEAILKPEDVRKLTGVIDAQPVITTNALIQKDPALVEKFVRAWIKSLLYIQQDPQDAGRLLQIYLHRQGAKISPETAQAWVGMAEYNHYVWSAPIVADAEYDAWGLHEANVLKEAPKLAPLVDNSFAERAMQSLGIK